jgi:methionyl-tRNA synthetase
MGNKYIDVQAPWALRKTDTDRFNTVMYVLAESLRRTALLLQPLTPTAASKLLTELGVAEDDAHGRSFASIADSIAPGELCSVTFSFFIFVIKTAKTSEFGHNTCSLLIMLNNSMNCWMTHRHKDSTTNSSVPEDRS